jgi:CTP-dependent riboflavin kinase
MRGIILSGLGQAQYFLTREGYSRQILERLSFVPFPRTLNVLLDDPFPTEYGRSRSRALPKCARAFASANATASS